MTTKKGKRGKRLGAPVRSSPSRKRNWVEKQSRSQSASASQSAPAPAGAMNTSMNMPGSNAYSGGNSTGGISGSSNRNNASSPDDSSSARHSPISNTNTISNSNTNGSFHNNLCTMTEENNLHVFLRDCRADRNTFTGIRGQNQRQPFEHISGRTGQWPAILHPGSVALVLVAVLHHDPSLALLQDCLIRHCRTVGIPWLCLTEHAHAQHDQAKSSSDRHRFLWDCITDKGNAACLFFPRGRIDLRVMLEPRSKPLAEPMSDRCTERLYFDMGWTRALCNAPEREQVYKLVLDCIAERQGYLPVEQELQIVMQQVEARTARLVLVSAQVWLQNRKDSKLLLKQCWDKQVPIFLVYDYHFCNNKRFPAVFSLRSIHLAREWQLQDLQELCRTMLARPLLTETPSASGGTGMGLGSVGGPSSPTGSIKSVARPIGGVATVPSTNSVSSRQSNVAPALAVTKKSSREVSGRASSSLPLAIHDSNSNSSRQENLSTVAAREPDMAASTRPVKELANGVSVENNTTKNDSVRRPLSEALPHPASEVALSHVAVSESPADLILSPGELSVPEQDRFLRTFAGQQSKANVTPDQLVLSIAFETEEWARWLHPDRIGFVVCVQSRYGRTRNATMLFSTCIMSYCQKVGIPCLRLRQARDDGVCSEALQNMMADNVCLCFDQSIVDLERLLDHERRPDLLASVMARRAPSRLTSDLTWTNFVCKWELCKQPSKCFQDNSPILFAAQIAEVSQMVEESSTRLVVIWACIWQLHVEITISLIMRCKQQHIPVLLMPSNNGEVQRKILGIIGVAKRENANEKLLRSLEVLAKHLLAREVPVRLAQVLQSRRDPICTLSESNLVWDLLERYGPTGLNGDSPGTDGSQDASYSSSAIVSGVRNVNSAIDQKKVFLVFVSLNRETTVGTDLIPCLKVWWEAKTPLLFLRMARRNVAYDGDKAVAFCLTSVRPEDKSKLRSLQALAAVKRKQVSDGAVLLDDGKEVAGGCIAGVVKPPRDSVVGPPTGPFLREALITSARDESIQSTVTRKREREDQGSPDSNEGVDAEIIPVFRSEYPWQQPREPTNVVEAPPSGHTCTIREETTLYEMVRNHLARADDSQRQQSLVRIGLNTDMWPQLLHPDRIGLVLVARFKSPTLKCLSDCVVEYCRRVAIPCLVLRDAMDGDSNVSLRKLVTENDMTCLGIRRGLFDLKDVVDSEKRPWMLATQIRSKTISKYTSGMAWTKLLCNERQREQVYSLLSEFVCDQKHDCFPSVKEQIAHLLRMFDKLSNKQARKRMIVITALAWLHHLPETNLLIQKCKKLCTPLFLIYNYPTFIGKKGENSCIVVSSISMKKKRDLQNLKKRDLQNLFHLGLEMTARPYHPNIKEARSVAVSHWKDGLCDPSESKAVLQLLKKCQFPASSGENPFFDVSRERVASASLIFCGSHYVISCVLQKRATLVFVALDSGGAFETEAVFALVELCRELGTPFLFVQEEVCVKETLNADQKQPIVFCLTSVLVEDEDVLRSLQDLASIKRNKVLGEFFQSMNVESCVNTPMSESANSVQHGVSLVAKEKENAMVEDVTKVSCITTTDSSRRQIPLIQSVTDVSVPTDKELSLLEETVSVFEASLKTLSARKYEVKANLAQEQVKRVHQAESVVSLQSRSEQLHTAQTRQLELEQELTRSIARSRTQLGRLTGHSSVLSTEDISELSGTEGDARASGETPESPTTKDPEESVSDQSTREEPERNSARGFRIAT